MPRLCKRQPNDILWWPITFAYSLDYYKVYNVKGEQI